VQSEVIRLDPLPADQRPDPELCRSVERLLKQAFLARRKMLRNTLAGVRPPEELKQLALEAGIDLQQRPQDVDPQNWVALARGLNAAERLG